jgi:hypothetical protein
MFVTLYLSSMVVAADAVQFVVKIDEQSLAHLPQLLLEFHKK